MSDKNKKLWGGRFSEKTSGITERMSQSIDYDKRLYAEDIRGSLAHAHMLAACGVISKEDCALIEKGLSDIKQEIDNGTFTFSHALEDIHMNIESQLTERIGDAGKRLHTGRSRNDQVALDIRLYMRCEAESIRGQIVHFIELLAARAEEHIDVVVPGYTHMQIAQPVRFSHHLLAHAWALTRDLERLNLVVRGSSILPLGAGALAGVNYPTDRRMVMAELSLSDVTQNSMDTVADRDSVLDFLYFSSVLGMHLSRFCEELVLWSTSEFQFIKLSDAVTTGSSIMPQKRNPDLAELIRGKTGRLYGNLFSLLTVLKGLPLTYNRDLQEDKEPLFDSIDTVKLSLEGITEMISGMKVNADRMKQAVYKNFSTATDMADYLVQKKVPFREAHEIVGNVVRHCETSGDDFFTLPVDTLKNFSPVFDDDVKRVLDPLSSTERKLSEGSTSRSSVLTQIKNIRTKLADISC